MGTETARGMKVIVVLALCLGAFAQESTLQAEQQAPHEEVAHDAHDEPAAAHTTELDVAEKIERNVEVTGRVFQSCTAGDVSARWVDKTSVNSAPNNHCYMAFLAEKTWFEARRACENLGGYLVTITSEDEMNFIWRKFGSLFPDTWKGPYIGFSDAFEEGDWRWVNGESGVVGQDTVYTNWFVGEPDDCCGGQDCASIAGGKWGYHWTDNKCHSLLPYICERNF
eukprot:c245_g1_i1.p1 GENE.c245_g1_i1~~c245_g1_i1.p1  ORF type:complete len:225 (-),score=30.91 c245_g1_i1:33-707(-)